MQINSEILQQCADDDRKAIRILFEYCFKTMMPVCLRYHTNEEDARSSLNLGFIKILNALKKTDLETVNFAAWGKRVMVNTLIDEYRRTKKIQLRELGKDTDAEIDYHALPEGNDAESNLGLETLMMLIKILPPISQKVFNLYVIDGFSHREISEQLEISEGTSKWHLSNARKILKDKIEKIEKINEKLVI